MSHHHPVRVSAPRNLGGLERPYLVQRDDSDFIAAMLAAFPPANAPYNPQSPPLDTSARAVDGRGRHKLSPPVQGRFHIALIEAWCDVVGQPRIDPGKVDAAGLVVRRIRNGRYEGWMRVDGKIRGWLPVERLGGDLADPLPATRMALKRTGATQIDRALRVLDAGRDEATLEEDATPMFVAPPDVCERARQTLYYGVVPTASSDRAEAEQDTAEIFKDFGADSQSFIDHLTQPLRGLAFAFPTPPLSGRRFDRTWRDTLMKAGPSSAHRAFVDTVRQVAIEFDVFDAPAAQPLLNELRQIRLTYALQPGETTARTTDAASFLHDASEILFEERGGSLELPLSWPALSATAQKRLRQTMSSAMIARFKTLSGRPGRFDDPEAEYAVRAFVRLKPEGACPPRTIWSQYSAPFVIAPWYESVGDPVQIPLPNLKDKALLKSLKPNVSFALPKDLQNLLSGDPKNLLDGEQGSGGFTIGWICSFSIPVITFCAFIVLNIFLSLFDLFFRWMLLIKICLPYPKAK